MVKTATFILQVTLFGVSAYYYHYHYLYKLLFQSTWTQKDQFYNKLTGLGILSKNNCIFFFILERFKGNKYCEKQKLIYNTNILEVWSTIYFKLNVHFEEKYYHGTWKRNCRTLEKKSLINPINWKVDKVQKSYIFVIQLSLVLHGKWILNLIQV